MRTFLVAFLLSLSVSALLTPLVLRMARRLSLFDQPDGDRKIHTRAIPRLGGISIVLGFSAPVLGLLMLDQSMSQVLRKEPDHAIAFFAGLIVIAVLGLIDDLRGLGAWPKLAVQVAVGVGVWSAGLSFDHFTILDHPIQLGLWSLPLTVLWIAGLINAMNLIDGLDGLAAGVAFFAAFSLFTLALLDNNPVLALFGAALGGSVLGFLLYNFSPALIFMGDTGSMTLGYIFATSALWSVGKRSTALSLLLPVVALGLPIVDTLFAFVRRALAGRSPFSSDRQHIHHRLIDVGLSHRRAVLILYLICVLLVAIAIITRATDDLRWGVAALALALALTVSGTAARRLLAPTARRRQSERSVAASDRDTSEPPAPREDTDR